MPLSVLHGVRVLEVSYGIAAPFCTKLLADYGAEVIKIERPSDLDLSRRQLAGEQGDSHSVIPDAALFLHLNTNKKSVAVDLETQSGQALFCNLASQSSVIVEGLPPGQMADMGIDYTCLKVLRDDLVMTSVTPFGQTGPYRDYQYTELTVFAMGGAMQREGVTDRHPLRYGAEAAQYFTGSSAASVTMAASFGALLTGQGDWIDVSIFEAMAGHPNQIFRRGAFAYSGAIDYRLQPHADNLEEPDMLAVGTFRCKDGYMTFRPLGHRMWPNIVAMIGKPELMDDPRFSEPDGRKKHHAELDLIFQEWLDERTRSQVFRAADRAGLPGGPLLTAAELLENGHFKSRNYFQEIDHPEFGSLTYTGLPFKLPGASTNVSKRAPDLGQNTTEVLSDVLGMTNAEISDLRDTGVVHVA
ncbi:CoA transferase [Dehalococcoidia bacterium]|nr:CoA transferase [Dehalococcoidia bacterium]